MAIAEQGDLLKVDGVAHPVIVVSNNFFNKSGRVIANVIKIMTSRE